MKTTVFIEGPPPFVSVTGRAEWIMNLLNSDYMTGHSVLDVLRIREISLAIATGVGPLDADFAQVIALLNNEGIPVTLWLTLSDDYGYWTNASNTVETFHRVAEILAWINEFELDIERIGFDMEWPVQIATAQQSGQWKKFFKLFRKYKKSFYPEAQEDFEKILETLEYFGMEYEFYVFPPILHKLSATGLSIPEGARIIEMDYSSFSPRKLAQWIIKKTRDFSTIPAIGIVNGIEGETPGRMLSQKPPYHLSSADIRKDIEAVGEATELYIFALNHADALKTMLDGMR